MNWEMGLVGGGRGRREEERGRGGREGGEGGGRPVSHRSVKVKLEVV